MEVWVDLASRFGVPTAILIIVLLYHARVVKEKDAELSKMNAAKDAELSRVNELRVKESKELADKMLGRDTRFLELLSDVDKTLSTVLERIR